MKQKSIYIKIPSFAHSYLIWPCRWQIEFFWYEDFSSVKIYWHILSFFCDVGVSLNTYIFIFTSCYLVFFSFSTNNKDIFILNLDGFFSSFIVLDRSCIIHSSSFKKKKRRRERERGYLNEYVYTSLSETVLIW